MKKYRQIPKFKAAALGIAGIAVAGLLANDAFSGLRPESVLVCSAGGSDRAILPQDVSRKAQEPRRLSWLVGFGQKAEFVCHVCLHKNAIERGMHS